MRAVWFAALLVGGLAACGETPPPECSTREMDEACLPQYVPSFDNVFANTISANCGNDDNSCHSRSSASGLSFVDKASAYANLIDDGYVVPGNPECSEMIVRITDTGEDYTMPTGDPLTESERCALQQWVRMGAPGPAQDLQ